ncbi:hypothetical protein D9611_000666 [Ephemerocybe angulata]|uniref:Uncharacterized protein n=1 Tax=Ephemerocybe angulata TaxID=980116 RepID=A0A8H5F788_9AGAR|nr:hypothetical protein D9611_000666 [Tulosesus angulatus]
MFPRDEHDGLTNQGHACVSHFCGNVGLNKRAEDLQDRACERLRPQMRRLRVWNPRKNPPPPPPEPARQNPAPHEERDANPPPPHLPPPPFL